MASTVLPFPRRFRSPEAEAARSPAAPPGPLGRVRQVVILWRQRLTLRRSLERELLSAPAGALRDAGWDRASLRRELAKPFWRG